MLEPKWLVWFAKNDFRIDVREVKKKKTKSRGYQHGKNTLFSSFNFRFLSITEPQP